MVLTDQAIFVAITILAVYLFVWKDKSFNASAIGNILTGALTLGAMSLTLMLFSTTDYQIIGYVFTVLGVFLFIRKVQKAIEIYRTHNI